MSAYWLSFCEGFGCMMSSEFYKDRFPEYEVICEDEECQFITDKVNHAISKADCNPTECLLMFVETCLENSRYADQFENEICHVIEMLMTAGASFPYDLLFESQIKEFTDKDQLEEECINHEVRAIMIDFLKPAVAKEYVDWNKIPATYWEDITSNDWRENLKYCSDYLRNL